MSDPFSRPSNADFLNAINATKYPTDIAARPTGYTLLLYSSASDDSLTRIQNLIGSDWSDRLTGDGTNNVLRGGLGNDTLLGGAGAMRRVPLRSRRKSRRSSGAPWQHSLRSNEMRARNRVACIRQHRA